jgi:ankyrin repeat protein
MVNPSNSIIQEEDDEDILFKKYLKVNDLVAINNLLSSGMDINPLLCYYARKGDLNTIQILVNGSTKTIWKKGNALIFAAENGYLDIVKFLLERGIDVNLNDDYALVSAVSEERIEVIKYLLSNGADAKELNGLCLSSMSRELIDLLLAYGVKIIKEYNEYMCVV